VQAEMSPHFPKNHEFIKITLMGKDQDDIVITMLGLPASVIIYVCDCFSLLCHRNRFHHDSVLYSHSSSYSFFLSHFLSFFLSFFLSLFLSFFLSS